MVSELFQFSNRNSYFSPWQITVGSMLCMCGMIFLGLKFKWFRAQLKLGDSPQEYKSTEAVQGIGFKLKSNSEDFQFYKVTSEFATTVKVHEPIANNQNIEINQNRLTTFTKVTSKEEQLSQTTLKEIQSPKVNTVNTNEKNSRSDNKTLKQDTDKKILVTTQKEKLKLTRNIAPKQSTNLTIESVQINKETSQQNNKKLLETADKEDENKISFVKNKTTKTVQKGEQFEVSQSSIHENDNLSQHPLQMRNPLAAQNIIRPQENEVGWKIRIVDEKPKPNIDNNDADRYDELFFTANNNSNTLISDTIYSSQAANIFFGSYDKPPPSAPPPRIPRKFLEDQDDISMNSQTSA